MHIESGLFDHMVLQRTPKDVCEVVVTGDCQLSGQVVVNVHRHKAVLKGFAAKRVGTASRGSFKASLKGLPNGGPYDIELQIQSAAGKTESLKVHDVLVGDVWILAGQSNMQGAGLRKYAEKPHTLVRAYSMDDRWSVALDPLHNVWNAVDPVHGGSPDGKDSGDRGVGPGVAFGREMQLRTGIPQGLIACAHGGTSMTQWDPSLKDKGGSSLYGAMIRRVTKNGGRVAGIAWYQGESDTGDEAAPLYTGRMINLVKAMRHDFCDSHLPIAMVQLGAFAGEQNDPKNWNSIQDQQGRLPRVISRCVVVPAIDLPLGDMIHICGRAATKLGRQLAEAMCSLTRGTKLAQPPIEVRSAKVIVSGRPKQVDIVVEFANVQVSLRSDVRPHGFVVCNDLGHPVSCIYDVEFEGSRAIVHTSKPDSFFVGKTLHYGFGCSPACNVVDSGGRSLPVFTLHLGTTQWVTPFVRALRVSSVLGSAGNLKDLKYPVDLPSLDFKVLRTEKEYEFLDDHVDIQRVGGDGLVYYACRIRCGEPMDLALLLGYDGPVKAWVDGKEVFCDSQGNNPAIADKAVVPFTATAGEHDVLVALGTNNGRAWGIFMRFERRSVTKTALQKGPITLPEIIG